MDKSPQEWLKQADYDMDTAEYMLRGGRNFYAVFMCHLSIEKALKGLYQERLGEIPPKTHNLVWLLKKAEVQPPEEMGRTIVELNTASVATRYPEEFEQLHRDYTQEIVKEILRKNREILEWIKSQF